MYNFFTYLPNRLILHLTHRLNLQLLYHLHKVLQRLIIHRIYFQNKGYFGRGYIFGKFIYGADFFHKIMVQDIGYFQKTIDIDFFSTEYVIHIGAVAMQQLGELSNTDIRFIKYFLDSFSDMNLF